MDKEGFVVTPLDEHNAALLNKVHPLKPKDPVAAPLYNLVVLGAGAGGLVSAAQAAKRGAKVALVEMHLLGGDCLNIGCVPSKALLSCAKVAHQTTKKYAAKYGVDAKQDSVVDFGAVMTRMRQIRAEIASNDSYKRFRDTLGVDVFIGRGEFTSANTLRVNGQTLKFCKAVVATGARAFVPPIPGLKTVGYHTNNTLFNLTTLPKRFGVIGAGPIGVEMAQAFQRFGSQVSVFEAFPQPLGREDPDAAKILLDALEGEGIKFFTNVNFTDIRHVDEGGRTCIQLSYQIGKDKSSALHVAVVDELLVSTGRRANVQGIGLEKAKVDFSRFGVQVNDYLQTSNPNIYSVGDVCLVEKFTHMAGESAQYVVRNALLGEKNKYSSVAIPWVTYTDPEVAHVGKYERDCKDGCDTFTLPLQHFDRCITDGKRQGFVRIHTAKGSDKILGATIVGSTAGELISFYTLAIQNNIGAKAVSAIIAPYPTVSEVMKYTANQWNIKGWGGWEGLKATHTPTMQTMLKDSSAAL